MSLSDFDNLTEIPSERSYTRKVYDLGYGGKRYRFHIAHKHFKDQHSEFKDIDQTLQFNEIAKVWHHSSASYYPILPQYADDVFEFYNNYEGANHTIKAIPQCSHVLGEYFKGEDGNGVLYKDAFGKGIDLKVYAYWAGLKKVIVINEKPADTKTALIFDFELILPTKLDTSSKVVSAPIIDAKTATTWSKSDALDFTSKTLKIGFDDKCSYFRDARVWDSGELNQSVDISLFVKDGKTYIRKTITPEILDKAVYPLYTDHPTSYYAGSGDGFTYHVGSIQSWDTIHGASSSSNVYYTLAVCSPLSYFDGSLVYKIGRTFFPIDTSGIDDSATISSAVLNIYISAKVNNDNDGDDWLNVVQTSQASTTTLSADDFDQCGSIDNPTEGATRIDIGNLTTSAYNTFTLNSTGIGWISKTGYTKLGVREGHDCIDSAPTAEDSCTFATSEDTSGTKDPYLDVTVEAAGSSSHSSSSHSSSSHSSSSHSSSRSSSHSSSSSTSSSHSSSSSTSSSHSSSSHSSSSHSSSSSQSSSSHSSSSHSSSSHSSSSTSSSHSSSSHSSSSHSSSSSTLVINLDTDLWDISWASSSHSSSSHSSSSHSSSSRSSSHSSSSHSSSSHSSSSHSSSSTSSSHSSSSHSSSSTSSSHSSSSTSSSHSSSSHSSSSHSSSSHSSSSHSSSSSSTSSSHSSSSHSSSSHSSSSKSSSHSSSSHSSSSASSSHSSSSHSSSSHSSSSHSSSSHSSSSSGSSSHSSSSHSSSHSSSSHSSSSTSSSHSSSSHSSSSSETPTSSSHSSSSHSSSSHSSSSHSSSSHSSVSSSHSSSSHSSSSHSSSSHSSSSHSSQSSSHSSSSHSSSSHSSSSHSSSSRSSSHSSSSHSSSSHSSSSRSSSHSSSSHSSSSHSSSSHSSSSRSSSHSSSSHSSSSHSSSSHSSSSHSSSSSSSATGANTYMECNESAGVDILDTYIDGVLTIRVTSA